MERNRKRTLTRRVRRFGLKFACLERTQLLEILYTHLPDKSRILTSKGVVRITPHGSKMTVTTADGDEFQGDLVVGADGVHSVTRREMWRIANIEQPGLIPLKEQASMLLHSFSIPSIINR